MAKKKKQRLTLDDDVELEDSSDEIELFKLKKFLNTYYPDAIDEYEGRELDRKENVFITE
jgi:hypothetical protein